MKSTPTREALNHFLATAAIGLALTGLSALVPNLEAQQQLLPPQTAGYAVLSLLISAGVGLYGYVKAHPDQLVDTVSELLDREPQSPDQQS